MAGRGGRGKISYVQQNEPDFIRKFKQRVGYKEGPSVDTKRQEQDLSDDDIVDGEDEKPVVVVLRDGDLTAEEAAQLQNGESIKAEDDPPADGKILFKKPAKRRAENNKQTEDNKASDDTRKNAKKKKSRKKKTSNLLSFDEENDDDGQES
ncbi:uncharacterized protein KIAA1143 homolog [Liolophura sinensis]|uniref:uncharacterized protein KIAA1143 homolog n=1 Tax=Liolophura sinensis TaxID=3198878 RepID=UPI003158F057